MTRCQAAHAVVLCFVSEIAGGAAICLVRLLQVLALWCCYVFLFGLVQDRWIMYDYV